MGKLKQLVGSILAWAASSVVLYGVCTLSISAPIIYGGMVLSACCGLLMLIFIVAGKRTAAYWAALGPLLSVVALLVLSMVFGFIVTPIVDAIK